VSLPRARRRERFFLLGVRRDESSRAKLQAALEASEAHRILIQEEPPRMIKKTTKANTIRSAALGNAICPASAKKAFEVLGHIALGESLMAPIQIKQDLRPWGCKVGGREAHVVPPTFTPATTNLVFDPKLYAPKEGQKIRTAHKAEGNIVLPHTDEIWPTPRHSNVGTCHVLTNRSVRDLGTAVRFEAGTKEDRSGVCSAEFIEWLMGVPFGYTDEFCTNVEQIFVRAAAEEETVTVEEPAEAVVEEVDPLIDALAAATNASSSKV